MFVLYTSRGALGFEKRSNVCHRERMLVGFQRRGYKVDAAEAGNSSFIFPGALSFSGKALAVHVIPRNFKAIRKLQNFAAKIDVAFASSLPPCLCNRNRNLISPHPTTTSARPSNPDTYYLAASRTLSHPLRDSNVVRQQQFTCDPRHIRKLSLRGQ
jgi:hypothetical protein